MCNFVHNGNLIISSWISVLILFLTCCKILEFDDDDDDDEEVEKEAGNIAQIVNIGPMVKATAVSQMEAAIDSLSRELLKLRTGRASAGKRILLFPNVHYTNISSKFTKVLTGLVICNWICRDA